MNKFWNMLDSRKTYSAIGILALAGTICPLFGVPAVITGGIVALGTALGIVGRMHAGSKLEEEQGKVFDLARQVEVLRQYKRVP